MIIFHSSLIGFDSSIAWTSVELVGGQHLNVQMQVRSRSHVQS